MQRRAFLLGLILLLAIATGATAGAASERHVIRGHGISLTLPSSWIAVDSRAALTTAVAERLARENPRLAPYLGQLKQPSSPLKFFAFDPRIRRGFATNVNVIVAPVGGGVTFAAYRNGLLTEVQVLPGLTRLRSRAVRVGGVQAVRLEYRFTISGIRVQTLQYGFLRGRRSIVATYTTLPAEAARYSATFARSAASIRFAS